MSNSSTSDNIRFVGEKRGYYLHVKHTDKKHWFAETFQQAALQLESVCNKHLTDTQYQYSVLYSLGLDVEGRIAWANADHTERVLDESAKYA